MSAADRFPIKIAFERVAVDNPWQDCIWQAVAAMSVSDDGTDDNHARTVHETDHRQRYLSGVVHIELFRKETEGYRNNLSQPVPQIYVVLHPVDDDDVEDDAPDMMVFHATVCPYEAESYTESGDETVDGVPMPNEIIARVQAFVDTHHVDIPFKKRKRNKKQPGSEKGWGGPAMQGQKLQ